MKFGTGSNTELTQKYERVKVLNDIHTSKHIYKQTNIPDFQLCYPCKCLARFTCSLIKHKVQVFRSAPISLNRATHCSADPFLYFYQDNLPTYVTSDVGNNRGRMFHIKTGLCFNQYNIGY